MIELLRNSKDKRARKLAKKRVSVAFRFDFYRHLFGCLLGPNGVSSLALRLVRADDDGLNYSLEHLDVQSARSMSCKVSSLSREGQDTR